MEVIKYSNITGQIGPPLDQAPDTLDLTHSNLFMAACNSLNGGRIVHLALWVNGRRLLDVNASNPVASGTLALFAATIGSTHMADVMQFKNLRVTQQ